MNGFIEIPFGAEDSELKGWEYTIPEDMEAVIEDGKIIVRQKKNEDERVRRAIIKSIEEDSSVYEQEVTKEQMLGYLEKQKYYWKPTEEDVTLFNKAITTNTSLTPQDRAKLDIIRMKFKHHPNIEQKEQKSAECISDSIQFDEGFKTGKEVGFREGVESVKPVEWSEEDEGILNQIIHDIEFAYARSNIEQLKDIYSKQISCLKSLRPSLKLTDEQKTALWNAIGFIRHRVQHEWYSKNGGINGMDYSVMLKSLESIYEGIKNK